MPHPAHSSFRSNLALVCWFVIAAVWTSALVGNHGRIYPNIDRFEAFGTHDFIQYWSAFNIFSAGKDPYDPHLMLKIQRAAGWRELKLPLMMWNPPWILLLMAPVLCWQFLMSAQLWFGASLILIGLTWSLTEKSFPAVDRAPPYFRLLLCFTLFPLQQTLFYGQSSVLLLFGAALALFGLKHRRDMAAAFGYLLLSIKPHLLLFFLALSVVRIRRERRLKLIGLTAGIFLASAATVTIMSPQIWNWWLADPMSKAKPGEVIPTSVWKSATVISILVYDYLPLELPKLSILRTAIPLGLAAFYLFYLFRRRRPGLDSRTAARAITLSVLFAPYGWVMDQALLLIPQVLLFQDLEQRYKPRKFVLSLLPFFALNAVYGWYCNTQISFHHQMFWLPAAFFVLSEIYYRWVVPLETEPKETASNLPFSPVHNLI